LLQRIFSFLSNYEFQLKRQKSSTSEETQRNHRSPAVSTNPGKDYVESLHQNAKSQLIYGKNNVLVQPVANSKKKDSFSSLNFVIQVPGHDPIPGYLSLHLNQTGLTLKWTPNQLMNRTNTLSENSSDNNESTENSRRTRFDS